MDFSTTLSAYLDAIAMRDLETLESLLAPSDQLTLIMPNGIHMVGHDDVVEFHRTWFGDPEWTFHSELHHTVETDTMALALLSVEYDDLDPSGQPYQLHYFLTLTFMLVGDRWLLMHDHNTLIHEGR